MTRIVFICIALFLFMACSSCVMDPESITVWGGDSKTPVLESVTTVSACELSAHFTDAVTVSRAAVQCFNDPDRIITIQWDDSVESGTVLFTLSENPGIGVEAALDGEVRDAKGNTLSFCVPFTGFNERVPVLRINELRTGYSKPKVEYLELMVMTDGNLGGVEIQNTMNSAETYYEFPFCEVRAGDYVVWHLRSLEEGLVDETDNKTVSGGRDSSPFAWDFWDTQERSPLKGTNVLLVRERSGGRIMDALVCAETKYDAWPNDALILAAEEAVSAGVWLPTALITDAACADYMTPTRTLGRLPGADDTNTAADWIVCATSGASPGGENSSKVHIP